MQYCDFSGTPSPRKDSSPGRIGGSTLGPHQGPSRTSQEADSWLGTDSCAPRNASFERIIYKCLSWDRLAAARTFQPVAPRPRPSSHRAEFSLFAPDSWGMGTAAPACSLSLVVWNSSGSCLFVGSCPDLLPKSPQSTCGGEDFESPLQRGNESSREPHPGHILSISPHPPLRHVCCRTLSMIVGKGRQPFRSSRPP